MKAKALLAAVLSFSSPLSAYGGTDCAASEANAKRFGVHIAGSESGRTTIGKGRVFFYSAPEPECKMASTFVVPGETLNAYIEHNGFTFVLYQNLTTATQASGWVISARLKDNGYGIAPKQ